MKKLEKLANYIELTDPSDAMVDLFNDVVDEAEQTDALIEDLQSQLWEAAAEHRAFIESTERFFRLKRGVLRNIKQLRRARNEKA